MLGCWLAIKTGEFQMAHGTVVGLFVSPEAGAPMQSVGGVLAIVGEGLSGDRYAKGRGSFNIGKQGRRQVTLINARFVDGSGFDYFETRRNIVVKDVELMDQIGHEFRIGEALLHGVKYCDPCMRPSKLSGKSLSFRDTFQDSGGLVAEVVEGGFIAVGHFIIPRTKNY
jgi:hypothetical protein